MHCIEVIIERNLRASGREAAHADNDGNDKLSCDIHTAAYVETIDYAADSPEWLAFANGYLDGRKEG